METGGQVEGVYSLDVRRREGQPHFLVAKLPYERL